MLTGLVGNAVPPELARRIFISCIKALRQTDRLCNGDPPTGQGRGEAESEMIAID